MIMLKMGKKGLIALVVGVLAIAGILVAVLMLSGNSGSAADTVSGDGYKVYKTYTSAQMPRDAKQYVESAAIGTKDSGSVEVAIQFTETGRTYEPLLASALRANAGTGLKVAYNGATMTVTGPYDSFAGFGGPNMLP